MMIEIIPFITRNTVKEEFLISKYRSPAISTFYENAWTRDSNPTSYISNAWTRDSNPTSYISNAWTRDSNPTSYISNAWSNAIDIFYNASANLTSLDLNRMIDCRKITASITDPIFNSNYLFDHYSEEYFLPKSYEPEAKRLQKLIKGTLLHMIERIKASLFLEEMMELRMKIHRLISISRKKIDTRFIWNTRNSKDFTLFEPESNEKIKIIRQTFSHDKSIQTITNFQILNTIAA